MTERAMFASFGVRIIRGVLMSGKEEDSIVLGYIDKWDEC